MARTTTDFLESVKTTITIPSQQNLLTDARILSLADEEIMIDVLPMLDSLNQEYFVYKDETTTTVSGTKNYDIPYRAVGRKLRDIKITDGTSTRSLTKVPLEEEDQFDRLSTFSGFNIRGDQVYIFPTPDSAKTLVLYYLQRPSKLVAVSATGKVTGVSSTVITLDNVPSTFTAAAIVDYVCGKSGYRLKAYDQTVTNVSGSQITVASDPTATAIGLTVGDYVAIQEQTPIIQFPDECYSYVVQRTAKRCLEALGDYDAAARFESRLISAKKSMQMLLSPRVEGSATPMVNRSGILRGNRRWAYWRGV